MTLHDVDPRPRDNITDSPHRVELDLGPDVDWVAMDLILNSYLARSPPRASIEPRPTILSPSARLKPGYIRHVRILPRKVIDGRIRCVTCIRRIGPKIEWSGLGNALFQYSALSYAWGDPTPRHCIFVDGTPHLIAHNLRQFLSDASSDKWYWIDALSIDQRNSEERRHQVGIMSTIFRGALEVIVWLGPKCEHSSILVSLETKAWSAATVNSVVELCERPYWGRLWVFQEIKHARNIMLLSGSHSTSWNYLEALFNGRIKLYNILPPETARRINCSPAARMIRLRTKLIDTSLWNLLHESRHLECTDRRDRVYALLSMATEGLEDIEPDYRASLRSLGTSVLRNHHTINPPESMNFVLQDWKFIAEVLAANAKGLCQYGVALPDCTRYDTLRWDVSVDDGPGRTSMEEEEVDGRQAKWSASVDDNVGTCRYVTYRYKEEEVQSRRANWSWKNLKAKLTMVSRAQRD
jgi:hypothetical protein